MQNDIQESLNIIRNLVTQFVSCADDNCEGCKCEQNILMEDISRHTLLMLVLQNELLEREIKWNVHVKLKYKDDTTKVITALKKVVKYNKSIINQLEN